MHNQENVRCEACGCIQPKALTEVHHKVHRALGGNDRTANLTRICLKCHKCVHVVFKNMKSRKPKDDNFNRDFLVKSGYNERAIKIILELSHEAYDEFVKRDCNMGGKKMKSISLQFTPEKMNMIQAASERAGYRFPKQWIQGLIDKHAGVRR